MSRIIIIVIFSLMLVACIAENQVAVKTPQSSSEPTGTPMTEKDTATVFPTLTKLPSVPATVLTPSPTATSEISRATTSLVSGDSGHIVFVSEAMLQSYQIYRMNIDGSNVVALTEGELNYGAPLWSPNGQKILFQSYRQGSPVGEDIWVMNADGTEQLNLTNDFAYNSSPDWSPDGDKVVFSSERNGNADIYVISVDGSNRVRLVEHPASDSHPAWSPDGRKIAFVSDRSGNREVYVMNTDGSDVVRLTENTGEASNVRWSSNGQQMAFTLDNAIWVMNADGSEQRNVSGEIEASSAPHWAPNGQYLVFAGQGSLDAHTNIYLIDIKSDKRTRLTDDTQGYSGGSWSPDGTRIIISAGPYLGIQDLYIINLGDSGITRLTNNLGLDCCADWQPGTP